MTNKGSSCNVANENLVAMISEINLLEDHDMGWWIDSSATRHVCKNITLFKNMEQVDNDTVLYMGNATSALVLGIGNVELEFTYGRNLTLRNVYYVP